jgi:hypothetical protein
MQTRARVTRDAAFFPHGTSAFLMYGILPSYAGTEWEECGTLGNGKLEIRASVVAETTNCSGEGARPGRGLFARTDFQTGCIISVYGGEPIHIMEAEQRRGTISHSYMLRVSDSDFVIDGSQFASGISSTASPSGVFLPIQMNSPQYHQGAGAMANHAVGSSANANLAFVNMNELGQKSLSPRVPVLRARRNLKKGDEILFNYRTNNWRMVM